MFFPKVSGIIATDHKGHFINTNGKPITQGTTCERLDRMIIREYLKKFTKEYGNAVFVTGENNLIMMGELLSTSFPTASMVVSNRHEVLTFTSTSTQSASRVLETANPLQDVYFEAMAEALKGRANIFVLGGKSVYEAFMHQYSHFIHVETGGANPDTSKKVTVFSDDPAIMSNCLIHSSMNLTASVAANRGGFKITEYTSEWWN